MTSCRRSIRNYLLVCQFLVPACSKWGVPAGRSFTLAACRPFRATPHVSPALLQSDRPRNMARGMRLVNGPLALKSCCTPKGALRCGRCRTNRRNTRIRRKMYGFFWILVNFLCSFHRFFRQVPMPSSSFFA